ncbi:carboxypeptidase regulatory-like domain-containing protein [Candidatus Poribacteria bacterium]|nr:carboxypeptidase regulatory-like domain-containing protein [Candidatus Poribacteria bacterium]MYB02501.1 carboxypeptidase regulatory-like domain-containing protein [Candidatus Poribacteria bacterium]
MPRLNLALICVSYLVLSVDIAFAQNDFLHGGTIDDLTQLSGTIRGQIVDTTEMQNPIEGVEVRIVAAGGEEYIATTDANGNYKHSGIPAGRYLISIYKEGYGDRLGKAVTVVNGGDHYVPLKMTKKDTIVDFLEAPVPMYWVLILCVIIVILIFSRTNR